MGEAYFNWIDTNGFEMTIQNEGFSVVAVDKSCHQNFKSSYLTWLSWRVGRASTEKLKACRTCSTIIFLLSSNHIRELKQEQWQRDRKSVV